MVSRYKNRDIGYNNVDMYMPFINARGLKTILQYTVGELKHPTAEQISNLTLTYHDWKIGDRLYKLAHEHYKDSTYWWVISLFNLKPTEAHFSVGDVVVIPQPLDQVLEYYKV